MALSRAIADSAIALLVIAISAIAISAAACLVITFLMLASSAHRTYGKPVNDWIRRINDTVNRYVTNSGPYIK